ncbi:hypothetical protein M201_gp09 [Haloarcula californiae tailed virus 2]|uniref:Uncharacterized protein n=1 Tax=Haloarcula californiae tailed virus 2 TaxID=1273747 RepID=R4T7U6_9CAUD|nr:hypothetical protein M201_gp09 [Haloarcula californiae tailed virus 2]AGM11854.1 hypothetical protein HCTV2_10 [Haloarcula californiae tailed virus 2]
MSAARWSAAPQKTNSRRRSEGQHHVVHLASPRSTLPPYNANFTRSSGCLAGKHYLPAATLCAYGIQRAGPARRGRGTGPQ